jgi:hypothetical protein
MTISRTKRPLLHHLLAKAPSLDDAAFLTFTMIHPSGRRRVPSRHIRGTETDAIHQTLEAMQRTNALGWGAYVGIAYRKRPLSRYRRGGKSDLLALPALFADVDRAPQTVLPSLQHVLAPSLIVASGGGTHLYWFLRTPTTDFERAGRMLQGLARHLDADRSMTVDQILRLPGTRNTKPARQGALCRVLQASRNTYQLADFASYEKAAPARPRLLKQPLSRPRARSDHTTSVVPAAR